MGQARLDAEGKLSCHDRRCPSDLNPEGEDELQIFDNDLSVPVGSHPQHSKKAAKATTASQSATTSIQAKKATMASKAAPASAMGSLAALRQRRGQDIGLSHSTPKADMARSVLGPLDRNVQTPAIASTDAANKAQLDPPTSIAGELPSVKKGMLAQKPNIGTADQAQKATATKSKMKVRTDSPVTTNNVAVSLAPNFTTEKAGQRGSLKRTAKAMKEIQDGAASTYDMPQSPQNEDEDEYRPSKRSGKGRPAQRKRAPASKPVANSPAPVKRTIQGSKAKASKQSLEPKHPSKATNAGPSNSTRGRMKAESGTAAPPVPMQKASKAIHDGSRPSQLNRSVTEDVTDSIGVSRVKPNGDSLEEPSPKHSMRAAVKRKGAVIMKKEKVDNTEDRHAAETKQPDKDLGASQQNAIVLSDAAYSSDDELSPVYANEVSKAQLQLDELARGGRPYQTPTAIYSSPPNVGKISTKPPTAGLDDSQSARKSTIISFSKLGPRNQGTASARSIRSSIPPTKPEAGDAARLRARNPVLPSSAAKSGMLSTREVSAAPSNVALDAREALAGLRKKHVALAQPAMKPSRTTVSAARRSPSIGRSAYREEDFTNIDQFEDDKTLINDDVELSPARVIDQAQAPRTLSQVEMPPPTSKAKQKNPINRAPIVPSMARTEIQGQRRSSDTVLKSTLGKRQRVEEPAESGMPTERSRKERTKVPPTVQQDSPNSPPEMRVVKRKPIQLQQPADNRQQRGHSQGHLKRQRSQGTVDIHGSPVPDGMVIGGLNTVLETFSQQAALLSDKPVEEGIRNESYDAAQSEFFAVQVARKQPARLSSNTKAVPAEPDQESQAITHVARIPADGQPFVTAVTMKQPPTDPFTSSEEGNIQGGKGSSTSAFPERLKRKAAHVLPRHDHTASKRVLIDNDPDKTLVEAEQEDYRPAPTQKRPKRMESFDSDPSSNDSVTSEGTSSSQLNMGIWRKALQPHQMNLFDELVTISHRLVRQLVSQEEATRDIVDDYRRRCEELVDSMRVDHAKDVQVYCDSLQDKKKRLRSSMGDLGRRLADCSDDVRGVRKEVRRQAAAAKAADGGEGEERMSELKNVMAAFC